MYFPSSTFPLWISLTSTSLPKLLVNIQTLSKVITSAGCLTQMYFLVLFAGSEVFLLDAMACDHCGHLCPVYYTVIMKPQFCGLLVFVSWITSALDSLLQSFVVL
jgi:olfactory receptor